MEPWLVGAVVGGLGIGLVLLLPGFAGHRIKCPDCGVRFGHSREPASGWEALWGGITCPRCDWADRRGRKIAIR
jgi:hypothetical protein